MASLWPPWLHNILRSISHTKPFSTSFHSMVLMIRPEDQVKARAGTFEMPFRGLWDEKFNQPIFGCNNLTASIQYYDEQPFSGGLTVRIDFVEGGVNTFLPMFNSVLRNARVQLAQESHQQQNSEPVIVAATAPPIEAFLPSQNMAFVDPRDPSRIYTTQPVVESADRRQTSPSWGISREGLRRR